MRSPPTFRSGRWATRPSWRSASAAALRSAYGALSALAERSRPRRPPTSTDDVRVCAQVDAVDIVALAEPLDGGRARITALG